MPKKPVIDDKSAEKFLRKYQSIKDRPGEGCPDVHGLREAEIRGWKRAVDSLAVALGEDSPLFASLEDLRRQM